MYNFHCVITFFKHISLLKPLKIAVSTADLLSQLVANKDLLVSVPLLISSGTFGMNSIIHFSESMALIHRRPLEHSDPDYCFPFKLESII